MGELAYKYKEFFYMFKEFWTTVFDFNILIGIIAGIATLVIQVRIINKLQSRNKKKEKAIALGHVVMAKRTKFYNDGAPGEASANSRYHATYRYVVNGKEYEYRYLGAKYPEEEIQMYYIDNPRKVFCDLNEKMFHNIFNLLPIIVAVIVICLLNQI